MSSWTYQTFTSTPVVGIPTSNWAKLGTSPPGPMVVRFPEECDITQCGVTCLISSWAAVVTIQIPYPPVIGCCGDEMESVCSQKSTSGHNWNTTHHVVISFYPVVGDYWLTVITCHHYDPRSTAEIGCAIHPCEFPTMVCIIQDCGTYHGYWYDSINVWWSNITIK